MLEALQGELIYIWYYFDIQLRQIFVYWVLGMVIGSLVSVFAKDKIHQLFASMQGTGIGTVGIFLASALGMTAMLIRLLSCYVCGVIAGLLVGFWSLEKPFFNFEGFSPRENHDTDPNLILRFLKNLGRNIKATGVYFLIGILLSALFQRYVPSEQFAGLFGAHRGFGVLLAATIGVPLYACGGGTIPLLQEWLVSGMSMGSAAAFMVTGPATKITNLGALKIVLGLKNFMLYIVYVMAFSLVTGLVINLIL